MTVTRLDFAALTLGASPAGTTRPWASATWEAFADALALQGVSIRKTSSVAFDLLQLTGAGTADGVMQIRAQMRLPAGGGAATVYGRVGGSAANPNGTGFDLTPTSVVVSTLNGGSYGALDTQTYNPGGAATPDGDWVWLLCEIVSAGNPSVARVKVWRGLVTDEPGTWTASASHSWAGTTGGVGIFAYGPNRGEWGFLSAGTGGDPAPGAPETPTVTVGSITPTTAAISTGAYSQTPNTFTHAATEFRVRDTTDDSIIYGPALVSSASTGPHTATGLPPGTSGLVGEARHKDSGNLWSKWGTSSAFETIGPPDAPTVSVSKIRRTTAYVVGSAYVHPYGVAHAATQARVTRISDSSVLYNPVTMGPYTYVITNGLPDGPSGTNGAPVSDPDYLAELRYRDANGLWSEWGESDPFQTLNLWESGEFVTHLDLLVERVAGEGTTLQSYADFGGRNWIKSVRVNPAAVDSPIGSGSATLVRQSGGDSIAPLVTLSELNLDDGAYTPALDFGREVEVYAGIALPGYEPDALTPVMRGITDDIEWPRKTGDVVVPFRDRSGVVSDTYLRAEVRYGSDEGVDALEVMQAIVDEGMGAGQYTIEDLTVGDRFLVTSYIVKDVSTWEALQAVTLMWGGKELRQVEGEDNAALAVIEPDRTNTTPDYAIGPHTYIECNAISTNVKNVRTIVRGRAVEKDTGEILVYQYPAEEDVGDDTLVQLYGPRYFQFDEDQVKGIDTIEELTAMVMAIYADLSTPPIPLEIETKFAPFASVGDVVEWLPDTVLRDESLVAAVLELSHSFPSPGVGRTVWRCAGKPKGRYATWQRIGAEVAGIGNRPTIYSVVLQQIGNTVRATVDLNDEIVSYSIYARSGSTPKADGAPIESTSKGTDLKPELRQVTWTVRDGTQYVLVRARAANGRWVEKLSTIEVTGIGGPGTEEDPPTDVPGTPRIFLGTVDGTSREFSLVWVNTNATDDIEYELFLEGVSQGIEGQTAGSTSVSTSGEIGETWSGHVRYTSGVGLEGPWSPMSPSTFITVGLP